MQCGHGATSGQIDETQLFYLMARGIARAEAERLLIEAFLDDAIDALGDEAIGEALKRTVTRVARRSGGRGRHERAAATIDAPYDVEAIRRDFPILSREVYGKPLVYLDNGASAQKPQAVIDAVTRAYTQRIRQRPSRPAFPVERRDRGLRGGARDGAALRQRRPRDEIIFTRNATEAINLVADSYGGMAIGEGDEIVLSIMEHHSNIVPWNFHRERKGAVIKWAPVADDGTFLIDEFEKLLTTRTKIVAITHMSNVLGTVVPVKEICRIAHARGIPVLVDGSQGAVHLPVDVQDIDCDFYAFTGHKLYGPTGIGVLYGKRELARRRCRPTWAAAR